MSILVEKRRSRIVICYKNFGAHKGLSHIGLGVSAMQNARMLREHGYHAEVWPILSADDLKHKLEEDRSQHQHRHHIPVTHVVISAPWLPTMALAHLIREFHNVEFAVVSHSNIGFLQADPGAIRLLREDSELERANPNFHIAANTHKLVTWWEATYGTDMLHLPNMYPLPKRIPQKRWECGTLRIGCFCAVRPYKNVLTAAAAALEIGVRLRVSHLEFWFSGGRAEGGGGTIVQSIKEMYNGVPRAKYVENNWESWPNFVKTVGSMDLLLQPSYTESFNVVVSDGISQGIPTVTSEAVDWVPSRWKADSDAASDIADVGIRLLHDPSAARAGEEALIRHNENGLREWERFLKLRP